MDVNQVVHEFRQAMDRLTANTSDPAFKGFPNPDIPVRHLLRLRIALNLLEKMAI